jgi:hypothetical protein
MNYGLKRGVEGEITEKKKNTSQNWKVLSVSGALDSSGSRSHLEGYMYVVCRRAYRLEMGARWSPNGIPNPEKGHQGRGKTATQTSIRNANVHQKCNRKHHKIAGRIGQAKPLQK